MATKAPTTATPAAAQPEVVKAPELLEIGELRKLHKTGRAVFAGVCAANGWASGKAITSEEYLEAINKFNGEPMSGPRKESEAKK
ncbi:hypothetical protein SDC9_179395 [bioreactor metagenome]|uniref:Uncharacterized protein n=1 Tax=bioreactor metagenome TaxID=1076179 RepID=A0A645GZT0_9ZZZZ